VREIHRRTTGENKKKSSKKRNVKEKKKVGNISSGSKGGKELKRKG